ncbi:MAG: GIY-YIG nuclease family protein [Clostridiales bacterium]|nr:GIY-YIG nuclease family protein [Clostridiales bacterium]
MIDIAGPEEKRLEDHTQELRTGNYTYLLRCADGSLYCGWTNHLAERVRTHNAGKGGKYTRSHRPVTLVYYEEFATRQEAMRREWEVKRLSHSEKLKLIQSGYQNFESKF